MSLTTGTLEAMRREWQEHLEAIPFFADNGIAVLVEDELNLAETAKTALTALSGRDGRAGAVVILETPAATPMSTTEFGPVMQGVRMNARVITHPEINQGPSGTNQSTCRIAEMVIGETIGFKPLTATSPFMAAANGYAPDREQALPTIDCLFTTSARLDVAPEAAATPRISQDAGSGEVTLSCATTGAAIFYTVNGNKPICRAGSSGTLYTGPWTPLRGTRIRARAYLAGYYASAVAELTV